MSELDRTAPSRGRSSMRGGRGSYSTRGGVRPTQRTSNATSKDAVQFDDSIEDEGELGDMKKKYGNQLSMIKDIFPQWSDADLLLALAETDGDVETTVERVAAGNVSQFSEVQKKTKDRSRSKAAKDTPAIAGADQFSTPVRGGRGRGGFEGTRGGRGRGIDRGRGGFRGARGGHQANDSAVKDTVAASVPTTESAAWDVVPSADTSAPAWDQPAAAIAERVVSLPSHDQNAWGSAPATSAAVADTARAIPATPATPATSAAPATPATTSEDKSEDKPSIVSEVAAGAKKTWASMFAKPKPAPVLPKTPAATAPVSAEEPRAEEAPIAQETAPVEEEAHQPEPVSQPPTIEEPAELAPAEEEPALPTPEFTEQPSEPSEIPDASTLAPSNDPLTEDNLENLPDVSHPPATLTAASTAGSIDPRGITPLAQQAPIGRPPTGGFQASAYRAAATPGRTPSYQRRVLEQQEPVVMPGHSAVDRATVQFGSMGLNGDADLDVDEEREEPETRTQPPQQSPPSQPRASLPPAPRQASLPQEQSVPENLPTPKQAPGLPPPTHQQQQDVSSLSSLPQDNSQSAYSQYSRYGQAQPEANTQAQKPFDPFSHQAPSTSFDQYASQPSAQQHQQGFNAFSSAPSDYSQYYTADQQRNAYQQYYNSAYNQQGSQGQDGSSLQQRSSSGFGAAPGDSAFASSQAPQQSQARYNDTQGSGHNTPNPSMSGQQQTAAPAQQMHQQTQHHGAYPGYPYGHPYYNSPYHAAYQNQFGFSGGYGAPAPFSGKGGMYGQPQGYGMNPPSSYDSTPANAGGFGQTSMRDSALGSGLGDYGRSSAQPSQLSSGGFGAVSEPFGRTQSGFQGQSQGYGQQQSMQQSGGSDELKPFGESKTGGPSPALGQPGRPGSATNSVGGQAAPSSALPPPQSHQQGFGGYPGFNNQGSQYGLGGLGGSGHQQQGAYGGYSGFGNTYGNAYGRGGWGGNYGH